ncbi:DUF885 family protein [Sphingosinicella sp. CPCC 101087]|uniref:DUF885 domain-containing protein n=1 Tax=Sphingosinicella sp. CPCC 101087 TaxID=2497754 RepID=UPI0013EB2718|nr:DUF885 family protein [Sphingosinicella sp. CPCC 101087]
MTFTLDRRRFLLTSAAATGAFVLQGCAGLAPRSDTAAARSLYDSIFEGMLRASPEMASGLGLDTGERAFLKSRLSDASPAGKMGPYRPLLDQLPQLRQIDRSLVEGRERAWLDTVLWLGERMSEAATFDYGGIGGYNYPIPYVISQLSGAYQNVPDFLDSQHSIDTREDAQAYVARLEEFARAVNQEVDRARADAARGVVPPAYIIDKALTQTRALRREEGHESGLVQSLVRRARDKGVEGDWATQAAGIVDGRLAAALDRQIALLGELRRGAGQEAAASRLPDGERFYNLCLRFHTSTALTPDQAHQMGLAQVAELQAAVDPLLRREGLTEGSVGARLTELGRLERYLYSNDDAGRAALIADLNRMLEEIRGRMPEYFNTIPDAGMAIRRVPPAIEAGAPRGYAQGGSLDGSRPGTFYINLVDTSIWPKWSLPTLTYHESVPGHLWQGAIVLGSEDIPLLHRNIGIPAFGEGWGLYAEQLADEIGVYADFPQGRIGMLQSFLYRAARIVLDTGLHSRGWSREQAIAYFTEQVGLDPISATSEVERYIVWPGQACSYKIGHNEMVRLREEARSRLGARFDIKSFHDAVLLGGDMPLEVLATVVADWTRTRLG